MLLCVRSHLRPNGGRRRLALAAAAAVAVTAVSAVALEHQGGERVFGGGLDDG